MIKRLLILVLLAGGISLAAAAQQTPPRPLLPNPVLPHAKLPALALSSGIPIPDSLSPHIDTLPLSASARKSIDSLRALGPDTVLSASAMLRQVDSLNAASSVGSTATADDFKRRMDSLMASHMNAPANQRSPGLPGTLTPRPANPGYSPGAGAATTNPFSGLSGNPTTIASPTRRANPGALPPRVDRRQIDPLSNLHRKYLPIRSGPIHIDSSSLVPGAFFVKDCPDSSYYLDWVNATLTWRHPPAGADSVLVLYRSFPYRLNAIARRYNYDSISNYFLFHPADKDKDGRMGSDNFFNFGNITYNGSFGRSITFGNSQDAVVTSNLNLQISGYLADSVQITAAITDNNIPIQPDGTTADLNEFDKIFLQFKKKNWAITMGDIDLRQNQNYFLNFYKRLQGASFETTNPIGRNSTNKTLVSAAIAKGKFTRNIFQGLEGNQGPYKLQGANGELYFIVLAGTEKVYIDGQLMQRGEDQDYTINYNTAEITFTPNRMITQDVRIQVEFEYADRNYLNVNMYLYDEANITGKFKIRAGFFSNSDSRNSPINQTLTADQNKFLSRLGDSTGRAFYPVASIDTFAAGKILYRRIDTTYKDAAGNVKHDSAYVFSSDKTQPLYALSFTNVGQGYGNYTPDLNGVNGSVFIWVAPVNGVMQGSYEAAQFLVTPKTQQVMTMGADYAINKNTSVTAEMARSHYDVNTLSTIDKKNDDGYAARFQFKNIQPLGSKTRGLELTSNLGYEYVQKTFQPLERLRPVEFTRDWGLSLYVNPAEERIYTAALQLSDKKLNSVRYEVARYERGDGFTGLRHLLTHNQMLHGWNIRDQVSLTTSDSGTAKGYYLRPSIDVSKKLSFLKNYLIGANYSLERNEGRDKIADTVTPTSFAFQTMTAYLRSPDKDPNHWGITYATRTNSYPYGHSLLIGDRSQTVNLSADLLKNPHDQFHVTATYRNLRIIRNNLTTQTADNSLLSRAEYVVNEWKGFLRGNLLYEVGSGQEQKKNYTYLQVPAGTGQYTWIDYNKDGIQQLSEFVLAQFQDQAQYIRIYTPTNEYVKANYNTFNYSFTLNPRAVIDPHNKKAIPKLLARIMLQTSLQLNQKQLARGLIRLNPFQAPLDDTSLITRSVIMVNTFSFNRSDPYWGFDLSNTRNGAKTLLSYGYETRQTNEWSIRSRLNINKSIALNATLRQGANQSNNSSSNFDSSNFDLRQFSVEPAVIYTRGSNLRIGLGYRLTSKQNAPRWGGQHYTAGSFNSDFKYNILQSTSVQGKFTMSTITYLAKEGGGAASTTSSVAYTILEGLAPGKNYLWNLDFTKRLGNNLEISLQYEGRKAGEANVVHTGRAALRALL